MVRFRKPSGKEVIMLLAALALIFAYGSGIGFSAFQFGTGNPGLLAGHSQNDVANSNGQTVGSKSCDWNLEDTNNLNKGELGTTCTLKVTVNPGECVSDLGSCYGGPAGATSWTDTYNWVFDRWLITKDYMPTEGEIFWTLLPPKTATASITGEGASVSQPVFAHQTVAGLSDRTVSWTVTYNPQKTYELTMVASWGTGYIAPPPILTCAQGNTSACPPSLPPVEPPDIIVTDLGPITIESGADSPLPTSIKFGGATLFENISGEPAVAGVSQRTVAYGLMSLIFLLFFRIPVI